MEAIVYIFLCQMEAIVFPSFQNCMRGEKDLKNNKHNSLHLGRKYARIFVLGHRLFLVAHSFPQTLLSEICSLLNIVLPQMEAIVSIILQIFFTTHAVFAGYCLHILQFSRPRA